MPSRESDLDRDGLLGTYLKLSTACRTLSNRENDFDGESDGDLWSQVSTHNGAAFAELFERHSKSVYNHCFRLTGSWSAAEDLTSVVFSPSLATTRSGQDSRRLDPSLVVGGREQRHAKL